MSRAACLLCIEPLAEGLDGLCDMCAERIANKYWKARTGEFLTWPNPVNPPKPLKATISKDLRQAIFDRDGRLCLECGSSKDLTLDHIVAESKGGKATLGNLRTLCRVCNSRKGAR